MAICPAAIYKREGNSGGCIWAIFPPNLMDRLLHPPSIPSPSLSPRIVHFSAKMAFPLISLLLFICPSISASPRPPNVILLISDDQDIELGSLAQMPKTLRLLAHRGLHFPNAFVSTPICCPSRSSLLTGLYAHNHQIMTNNQNCAGLDWRNLHEKSTFAVHLAEAGYLTGYFGKYLNEYDGSWIPPGWHHWEAIVRNSRYYNYSLNVNGQIEAHGFDYHQDYFTDLVANRSIQFIRNSIFHRPKRPFLTVLSFPAPHGPEDPAPQFAHLFEGIETHRTKSWNYAPNPDKQWLLQRTGKMEPMHVAFTDQMQRRRIQTLQSVDEAVEKLVQTLRSLGQLHNTFLLYTSDHGFHLGQFGLIKGKSMPYEFDIRVPFLLRGPGVPRGKIINSLVANIDIAPTILAMAGLGANLSTEMDGRSILDLPELFGGNDGWRETVLIERGKMPKMRRIGERLKGQKERMKGRRRKRIQRKCAEGKYPEGCKMANQKWQCLEGENGGWRIGKCPGGKCECEGKGRRRREENENEEEEFMGEMEEEEEEWSQGDFEFEGKLFGREKRQIEEEKRMALLKEACSGQNIRFCRRILGNESLEEENGGNLWKGGKTQLNAKIKTLRRRLTAFKGIRKALKGGRGVNSTCKCAKRSGKTFSSDLRRQREFGGNNSAGALSCHIPQLNCFHHSAHHWRTPPFWPPEFGQFCFCQNANNNSYWCLRTVNSTHNFLYCEFVTEELGFYDLDKDPNQLVNSVNELAENVLEMLSGQLRMLKSCKGREECGKWESNKWNEGDRRKWK